MAVILSLADQEFQESFFDFAYLERGISKMDSQTAQGIHLLSVGNAYTEVEDTKNLILALPEKEDYMELEKAIAEESRKRLLNAMPERIDGIGYGRKELREDLERFWVSP